ncbi:MAG: ureidoglycolate lyase [Pseudomonadota bacterium]|nr:ureidoglycolate lyase [Pseudomonadota bacterium]
MMRLMAQRLTAAAFAPYGQVIEVSDAVRHFSINQGQTERYHDLAQVDTETADGRAGISIFRAKPQVHPVILSVLEHHPLGSQAFMPLSGQPYLIVVAPAGDPPTQPDQLAVFLASSQQGVNYAKGVWHHPLLALRTVCDFLVVDRMGSGHNCHEINIATWQVQIDLIEFV